MSSNKNSKEGTHNFELRLYVVQYLVLAMFIGLGIRFYFLQVSRHENYRARAENNRIREIPIPAARGKIFDRNGVVLVDNTPAWNIIVTPEDIPKDAEGRETTIRTLVENLGVDRDDFLAKLNDPLRPKSQPILVKQNASDSDKQWVAARQYEHPEIQIEEQPQRLYPHGLLAAHLLGYVGEISEKQLQLPRYKDAGYKMGDIIGKGGIEAVYDYILRGKEGRKRLVVDSRGRPQRELEKIEPTRGQDLTITLDFDIQRVAEQEFDKVKDTGSAIAMNPQNGEILAMVSRPAFDPNIFARNVISGGENRAEIRALMNDPKHPLYNDAIQGIYPTGSTWKLMMSAMALEEGVITPKNSRIACGGGISMGNRFVRCMGNHGAPDIHTAIVRSCDGYYYRLGLKIGIDKMTEWLERFGVGKRTGLDLPSENPGIYPSREWKRKVNKRDPEWKDFDTVSASIGQGAVAISPLQLLYATTGVIMDGEYHTPHLFLSAKGANLETITYKDEKYRKVSLSPQTSEIVRYGSWGVVNEGGTAGGIFPRELNVGGKTGTAQVIAMEKSKGIREHNDHAWFISFAPLHTQEKPEFACVVITEHGGFGGKASAPKAKMIHAAYFSKKLGYPVIPEMVAKAEKPVASNSNSALRAALKVTVTEPERKRQTARQ